MKAGDVIKNVRKKRGMCQEDLAKAMTVGQPYISMVENNRIIPTPMFIKLFCLIFSVDESLFN